MTTIKTVRIPDPNEPKCADGVTPREPDGEVDGYYFWLGDDTGSEIEEAEDSESPDMGNVDQSTFDFGSGDDA